MKTEVVNKKKSPYDIYIGRGSIWGNPFEIGKDGNRTEVIKKYRTYINNTINRGIIKPEQIESLIGKRLGCFCKPKACHGDVLVNEIIPAYLNEKRFEESRQVNQ